MCGGQGLYGKSLYLPLHFAVNLRLPQKNLFLTHKKSQATGRYVLHLMTNKGLVSKIYRALIN